MQQETTLYLVRHGETEWNREGRLQGNGDSPLTENGRRQAAQVREALQSVAIEQAYVSPLKRAVDTMAIIVAERAVELVVCEPLREISLGPWEGKTRDEVAVTHPDQYRAFVEQPDQMQLDGAETFAALQQRVVGELERLFEQHAGERVLVVSHWMAIKVALAYYAGVPLSQLATIENPANGAYLKVTRRGGRYQVDQPRKGK